MCPTSPLTYPLTSILHFLISMQLYTVRDRPLVSRIAKSMVL